jgi:two-component system OmpR family response regulator
MKALIVEDEIDLLDYLRTTLMTAGHVVTVAETSSMAMSRIREYRYDVILLDYCMPGFDPVEFVKSARERDPEARIILMSAVDKIEEAAKLLGCAAYLRKPFEPEHVIAAISIS